MTEPSQRSETVATLQANHTPQTESQLPANLRRIVLTGFMGSGKSTVGRLLAERLGWTFVDLDQLIESRANLSVPEIFALHGEPYFRRVESTALAIALGRSNIILALGGGAPETLTNRLLLEQTPATVTLLLDAPFPTLFDRCVLQALDRPEVVRPILADPPLAESRFSIRQPHYRRLARHIIDTATQSPVETAEVILETLKQ